MFRHVLLASLGAASVFAGSVPSARAALQLIDTVDLRLRQGRPLDENVLKLFGIAIDSSRNRVYSTGIMSSALGVLDGASETWTRNYFTGVDGFALKYTEVDAVAKRLYVNDASNYTLRAIDLTSGQAVGPVTVARTISRPVADTRRGLVYLTQPESPTFRAYNGADLTLAYGSDAMGTGAAHAIYDETSDRVYVLDAASSGVLRIYAFDPDRNEVVVLVIDRAGNGTQAESGGHLLFFDAATFALARDLPLSKKPHQLAYNHANRRFYLPESDASTV